MGKLIGKLNSSATDLSGGNTLKTKSYKGHKTRKWSHLGSLALCSYSFLVTPAPTRYFKLVWAQGRGPDTPGGSKNASGSVDIPLKRDAFGAIQ